MRSSHIKCSIPPPRSPQGRTSRSRTVRTAIRLRKAPLSLTEKQDPFCNLRTLMLCGQNFGYGFDGLRFSSDLWIIISSSRIRSRVSISSPIVLGSLLLDVMTRQATLLRGKIQHACGQTCGSARARFPIHVWESSRSATVKSMKPKDNLRLPTSESLTHASAQAG
jgi:hypothetical protein